MKGTLSARVIVFNVKGEDLMFLDQPNRLLDAPKLEHWRRMGMAPRAFEQAEFLAPRRPTQGRINRGAARVVRPVVEERQTRPYYWTLSDIIRLGLWPYLFSDTAQQSEPLMALADHVLGLLTEDCPVDDQHPYGMRLRAGRADTFSTLRDWIKQALSDPQRQHEVSDGGIHTFGTKRALLSRLGLVLDQDGRSIFSDEAGEGRPLMVLKQGTPDPLVIDIATLPPELRRFVVAAVLEQVKSRQMSDKRIPGQVYFLMLDELGIYAPRGGRDPITRLIETIATQLRSQGIILLGAQQQASGVSDAVFGNAEVKALGATSPVELESAAWRGLLTPAQKSRVLVLQPNEKLVGQLAC